MCGILFAVSNDGHVTLTEEVLQTLRARGPDSLVVHREIISFSHPTGDRDEHEAKHAHRYLTFASSVLSLRGDDVSVQPLIDKSTGSILCWNGEAWKIDGVAVTGNDSQAVFARLLQATATSKASIKDLTEDSARSDRVVQVLTKIAGPYAFVFYDAPTTTVYYGRDRLGRRSLVINSQEETRGIVDSGALIISSFDTNSFVPTVEVATTSIHSLDLRKRDLKSKTLPWTIRSPQINKELHRNDVALPKLPSVEIVESLHWRLSAALRPRILNIPTYNTTDESHASPSRLAILFSGGLDCTLLARLCHDLLPIDQSIDLLNIAFENPRTVKAAAAATRKSPSLANLTAHEACPDRITGRSSFAELAVVCPDRLWRFVTINVPYTEVQSHRQTIIRLMQPHDSEMDLSIGMALYFAARGQGFIAHPTDVTGDVIPYATTARVLLSGLGADELFGGYSRHAAAFSRGNWQALNDELELDFTRIGTRNLGRDDRVMAYWAREVRYPFLDEDFVDFAVGLPVWEKCGFRTCKPIPKHYEEIKTPVMSEDDLDPAKMSLRLLMWRLGMQKASSERKRAIQFGARTAKMEAGRTKGTDKLMSE